MMMRTSRRSRKAPERLTYEAREEDMDSKVEDDENLTDPSDSDYEDENARRSINKFKKKKKSTTTKNKKNKKKRARVVFVDQEDDEEDEVTSSNGLATLYSEIVKTDKSNVDDSVRKWMKRYEKRSMEEENGLVSEDMVSSPTHELLAFTLLVTAGDAPKSLPSKVISLIETNLKENDGDVDVEILAKEFSEKINVLKRYPIVAKKNIRNAVVEFWETLMLALRNDVLFEENFLETLVSWLVSCSSATLRALRHTSTISAYAIADSLLDIMSELSTKLDVDRRRLSTEQKKSKASSKRVADLKQSVKTCETNLAIAQENFSSILHGVLVHRSDDVDPHIRVDSIASLGEWSWKSPELVLKKHQSRLAKMFQDPSSNVRKGAVDALNSITNRIKDKKHFKIVKSLVTRTKKQILGLAVDVDDRVTMSGLSLLETLSKRGLLWKNDDEDDEDEEERPELKALEIHLFAQSDRLQHRAAKFLKTQLRGLRGDNVVAKQQIRALVDLAVRHGDEKSGNLDHVDYLVRAFERVAQNALSDCVAMCEMLRTDTKGTKSLSDYQCLILSRILFASYNCFKDGSDRTKSRGVVRARQVDAYEAHAKVFSDTLALKLPDLLERFLADSDVTQQLLKISTLINVESFANNQQQSKKFKKLLTQLRTAFETHSEPSILNAVAESLQHLAGTSHGRQSDAVSEISSLARHLVSRLDGEDDEEDEESSVSRSVCLRRLYFLLRWNDVTSAMGTETMKTLTSMLRDCVSDIKSEASIRVMKDLPAVLTVLHFWKSEKDEEDESTTNNQDIVDVAQLFCDVFRETTSIRDENVREMLKSIFVALCDLRILRSDTPQFLSKDEIKLSARVSKFLIETSSSENDEIDILSRMITISDPSLNISMTFEGSYLLSLLGQCNTEQGNENVEVWSKAMAKTSPKRYLVIQLQTLQRQFLACRRGDMDTSLTNDERIERYVDLLNMAKKLSRFYGVGYVPKKLAPSVRRLLENGIRFAFEKLPTQLGFLDVLEYYVRTVSKADKREVGRIFSDLVTEFQIEETRDQDENSETTNQGAWQAYDSFASSLETQMKKSTTTAATANKNKRRIVVEEEENEEISPKKKQRLSVDVEEEKESVGWKRKRRSRSALNLNNLSDDDDDDVDDDNKNNEVEIETKKSDDNNDDNEYGQTQDISGFRRRRRRRRGPSM